MENSVLLIYGLQVALLPFQIISYLSRSIDKSRLRFLIFNLLFIGLNSIWVLPESSLSEAFGGKSIILIFGGTGLFLYVHYYIYTELAIHWKPRRAWMLFSALATGLLLSEIFNKSLLGKFYYELTFYLLFQVIIILVVVNTIRIIHSNSEKYTPFFYAAFITSILSAFIPYILYSLDIVFLKIITVNLVYISITTAYLWHHISQMRLENMSLGKVRYFSKLSLNQRYLSKPEVFYDVKLTSKEDEVATFILEGLSNAEISNRMFIAESTVRKHISNIYSKTGTSSIQELVDKYSPYKNKKIV